MCTFQANKIVLTFQVDIYTSRTYTSTIHKWIWICGYMDMYARVFPEMLYDHKLSGIYRELKIM